MCGNGDAQRSGRNESQALLNLEELEEKLDLKDKAVKWRTQVSKGKNSTGRGCVHLNGLKMLLIH